VTAVGLGNMGSALGVSDDPDIAQAVKLLNNLHLDSVEERGTPAAVGRLTGEVWRRFAEAEPDADFTRIHPFVAGGGAP
jgi:hypothetical protein